MKLSIAELFLILSTAAIAIWANTQPYNRSDKAVFFSDIASGSVEKQIIHQEDRGWPLVFMERTFNETKTTNRILVYHKLFWNLMFWLSICCGLIGAVRVIQRSIRPRAKTE